MIDELLPVLLSTIIFSLELGILIPKYNHISLQTIVIHKSLNILII